MDDKNCLICQRPSDCQHFGAKSCRSCASFFRRAVLAKRHYKCLRQNRCKLNGNPRKCKACRFALCKEIGMKDSCVQSNRDPLGPKNSKSKEAELVTMTTITQIDSIVCPDFSSSPKLDLSNLQILNRLFGQFHEFEKAEKALYALLFPEYYTSPPTFRSTIHTDYIKMARGTMTETAPLLEAWYPLLAKESAEFKNSVLRSFFPIFTAILIVYRTSKVFPEPNDSRIALAYGQYECIEDFEHHYQHNENPQEANKQSMGFRLKTRTLAARFKELEINCVEVVAMAAILLSNELEVRLGNSKEIDRFREMIYNDLHQMYAKNETESRVGTILCLLNEIEALRRQIAETVAVLKIFSPHRLELLD